MALESRTSSTLSPTILFEDAHLIVIDKPAGLLSQGEKTGDLNLVDWLRNYWGRPYVGLIHRLDRNTSGVMVVAKRTKAAQRLTQALQTDQIRRSYLAWVLGSLAGEIHWKHTLVKDRATNKTRVIKHESAERKGAQEAILDGVAQETHFFQGSEITLLKIELQTGRSHQIRAQCSFERHPLLGDSKYGADRRLLFPRPALHSFEIEFPHPMSKEQMIFQAPIPADFRSIKNTAK